MPNPAALESSPTTNEGSPRPSMPVDPNLELAQHVSLALTTGVDTFARRMYLIGEVNEEMLCHFLPAFQVLDSTQGAIQIVLASPGGSEPIGWAIYDAIKLANNPVVMDGYGGIYSIAASIFQSATFRRIAPNARFMIHNGSVMIDGGLGANEAVGLGDEVKKNNLRYHQALSERSSFSLKEIATFCNKDTFFTAKESVKHGFADAILEPMVKKGKSAPKAKK